MKGAIAKAMPAASPAFRASWSRGHSTAAATALPAARAHLRSREGGLSACLFWSGHPGSP